MGWARRKGGTVVAPSEPTCYVNSREGRTIDFFIVSNLLASAVKVGVLHTGLIKTHELVRLRLDVGCRRAKVWRQVKPKCFDRAMLENGYKEGTLPPVPVFPKLDGAADVDSQAASWIKAVECELCQLAGIPESQQHRYKGRAEGPTYRLDSSTGPPGRPWKSTTPRARAALEASPHLVALLRADGSMPQRRRELELAIARRRGAWVRAGLPDEWKACFRNLRNVDHALLLEWATQLSAAAREEIKSNEQLNFSSWKDWAKESVAGSASAAHKWTKPSRGWTPTPTEPIPTNCWKTGQASGE